jgi:hypothetical protein
MVTEGLELMDELACAAGVADAVGEVIRTKVVEASGRVGQQMPDDGEDGTGDGDQGAELAWAFDQRPAAFTQEGRGLGGSGCGLAQCAGQLAVAVAGLAGVHPGA